jgi:hypothetical protein
MIMKGTSPKCEEQWKAIFGEKFIHLKRIKVKINVLSL